MPLPRMRAAVVTGALLVTALPFAASAVAPHLTCGPVQTGRWDLVPVRPFQPVSGLPAPDVVSAYGVSARVPQLVEVTNGVRVQESFTDGCGWTDAFALSPTPTAGQTFAGTLSTIVSVAELGVQGIAAVQTGSGSTSVPHVVVEAGPGGSWTTSDTGLPAQGAPRLLRPATDGRTAYLTISPDASGGSDNGGTPGPLPGLPTPVPVPTGLPSPGTGGTPAGPATGLLYATTDGGQTWALRTGPGSLPTGGAGFDALAVDTGNPNGLYALSAGSLLVSHDGGATFTTAPGSGYTAVTAMGPNQVVAFTAGGQGMVSSNGGTSFRHVAAPTGITSAAWRLGDSGVLVDSHGVLRLFEPSNGHVTAVPAPATPREGTLTGDDGYQSSFHAIAGHSLLRYVDPLPPTEKVPPVAAGDAAVAPPVPGVVSPAERDLTLPTGKSTTADFTLDLPKNPTPLDLFFLIDVSGSMSDYITNLKHNLQEVVDRLQAAKVDLEVGIGTLGTAPAPGEAPYPDSYVYPPTVDPTTGRATPGPTYRKPRIYELISRLRKPGPALRQALNSVQIETDPPQPPGQSGNYHEGQLLALEQMVTGSGVQTEQDVQAGLSTYSAVTPGQEAGFRPRPDVRRIVVIASDEKFDAPYGTPTKRGSTVTDPILDFTRTLRVLNSARVGVFGITAGSSDSVPDMQTLARGTHTFSPPGGVSCGGDPVQVLKAGAPLVCSQAGDFSAIIGRVLSQLTDVKNVTLQATASPVLRALGGAGLLHLDVKRANRAPFSVTVSCAGVDPGDYAFDVQAMLRGYPVGTARVRVSCVGPLAAVPPVPLPLIPRPPVVPAVQPPVPPPPPPPAAQPNPQPNPNVNPLAAGVTQEQQEAQLALAQQEAQRLDDAPDTAEQLAMVDRRRREPVQALGSLLLAMTVCTGLGLARLRARTAVETATG